MKDLLVVTALFLFTFTTSSKVGPKEVHTSEYYTKREVDSMITKVNNQLDSLKVRLIKPEEKRQNLKLLLKNLTCRASDIRIDRRLLEALKNYSGPHAVITSLRRVDNPRSKHFKGLAADLRFDASVVDYLVSSEGQRWLKTHQLDFYIEDNRKSSRLRRYLDDPITRPYCKVIPWASGLHIHIFITS